MTDESNGREGGDTAEAILEAAGTLFARKGYHGTSTREIAAAVGIKQPSLFHWFASKEAILRKLAERALVGPTALVDHLERTDRAPSAKLYEVVYFHTWYLCSQPIDLTAVIEGSDMAAEAVAEWRPIIDHYTAGVRRIVEDGIEAGEFVAGNANAITMAILGMCNWTLRWYRKGGPVTPEALAEQFAELALRSVLVDRRASRRFKVDRAELEAFAGALSNARQAVAP
ncbi:MAG TPA: TetR/AcrR family transcriptional regulator [Acidimicrobiia bacterium]|nr:TetR/AcrR family transcriptional regulator [Acidimicrobiia bacterium]